VWGWGGVVRAHGSIAFTPATPQAPEGTANASCLFITRPCAEGQQGAGLRAKLKIATDDEWDAFVRALPDIPERGLGKCTIRRTPCIWPKSSNLGEEGCWVHGQN
jgi:hypothetical protein